ncbi:MAG: hypothetical protein ACT4P1_01115 [Sporichthyaceae bacterium]
MILTVAQQLTGIRNAMTKVVMPGLDPADKFAQEQAGLIIATLNWILDVQGSEYPYEAVENAENRALLIALADAAQGKDHAELAADLRAAAAAGADGGGGELPTLDGLRSQTRTFKALAERLYEAMVASADPGLGAARALMVSAAAAQTRREQSWFRMTGFPTDVEGSIAEVLASSGPAT